MVITKRSRKQIEQHISKCAESIQKNGLEIGRDLIEIRDNKLWADEYDSWNQYLKDRASELVGKSFTQATNLIRASEISNRLPASVQSLELSPTHLNELGRLAPNIGRGDSSGVSKDISRLRKQDVARVLKAAGPNPSVRDVRAAVDADKGIDRAAERKEKQREAEADRRKRQEQVDADNELSRVIHRLISELEDSLADFEQVTDEGWEWLEDHKPGLCQLLAKACDELAAFMRG